MNNTGIVYAEVDAILSMMDEKYVNKIPKQLRAMFEEEKNDYKPKIDAHKSLNAQNLQRETLVILSALSLNYWCESEEEKQWLIKAYSENEKKNEAEIREKYNPDNIFKMNNTDNEKKVEIVQTDENNGNSRNIFKKIWAKIKLLLNKN